MQFTENKKKFSILNDGFIFLTVIFFSILLRLSFLDNRPFHTDEAVHAVKFGELLETGKYIYDPIEYHGPTLNYFTLVTAFLNGETKFSELDEITLRLVPAVISALLLILFFNLRDKIGYKETLIILLLLGFLPSFIFYSRYYIQESMLVVFTYSSIITFYKYFISKEKKWLIISGILAGLIFATKETSIIIFGSALFSLLILSFLNKNIFLRINSEIKNTHYCFIPFLIISILFYSSFFTNLSGIVDSLKTFTNYFSKAGANKDHIQPWYYYFDLIFFTKNDLFLFSQIPVFIFTIIGAFFSFKKRVLFPTNLFFRFITIFSFTQAAIYSAIPYKTPWLILNFWIGFIILAGYGISNVYKLINLKFWQIIFSIIISAIIFQQIYLTLETSYKYPYQPENPFTYSQPQSDIINASDQVLNIAAKIPVDIQLFINVIADDNDYWPLPWYLRKLNNIAWNNHVTNSIYDYQIILAKPNFEDEIIEKIYSLPPAGKKNLYIPLFENYVELRPNVELRGYVQSRIYDSYLRSNQESNIYQ